jgi:hypothetical protein
MPFTRRKIAGGVATIALVASLMVSAGPASATEVKINGMPGICASLPKTTTQYDGVPGPIFWKRLQCMASRDSERPYTGPIDGVMGPNSWMGVSARLRVGKYFLPGPLSSSGDSTVIYALQRWGQAHGFPSWHTGRWNDITYKAVAHNLNIEF